MIMDAKKAGRKGEGGRNSLSQRISPGRLAPIPSMEPKTANVSIQCKIAGWPAGLNKKLEFYSLLAEASISSVIRLYIPETIVLGKTKEEVTYLYTDAEGTVRCLDGDSAVTDFLYMTEEKNHMLKNLNPLGVRFPKYLTFSQGSIEFTIPRNSDLRVYLSHPLSYKRIQRYIWPEDYTVKTTLVRWRRTKRTKLYTVIPRTNLRNPGKRDGRRHSEMQSCATDSEFELNSLFVVDWLHLKNCDVSKSKVTEEVEGMLDTVRKVLGEFALRTTEQLEEMLIYLTKCQDGKYYFFDLPSIRVSIIEDQSPILELKSDISVFDREKELEERLRCKMLPHINEAEVSEQMDMLYRLQMEYTPPPPGELEPLDPQTSQRIAEISSQFDQLVRDSQELKKEFGVRMKVQLDSYPKTLLETVIRKVYDRIIKDPRLSRYFPDKSRMFSKLLGSVRAVFLTGLTRNIESQMHRAHFGMGITDADFQIYIRYFTEAMLSSGVSEEHVSQTQEFLESFRSSVVQRMLEARYSSEDVSRDLH